MEAHLSPVRESKNASEKHSASPPSAGNHRRSGFPFKRISSASEVLGRGASLEGTLAVDKIGNTTTNIKMDRIPKRRSSEFTMLKDTTPTLSSGRHSASLLPTVSSVAEKFNFGLKEKLRKSEKDREELQRKYQELVQTFDSVSKENEQLRSSQHELEGTKKALESKYHKLKSHADVMKADYDRVNAKLSNLEVANESLKQTSWIRQSRKSKETYSDSRDGVVAANEVSTLKRDLTKKDAKISELEKDIHVVEEKLKQAKLQYSVQIKVDGMDSVSDEGIGGELKFITDRTTLNSLDKSSVLLQYEKLLSTYRAKVQEIKDSQNRFCSLEKLYTDQKKEIALLNMELHHSKSDNNHVLSSSNNALHSPQSSVTVLGVPSTVVKSASFDNGRRVSLPTQREAASSPDVSMLQNCLKLSLSEKKMLEEEVKELKQQLQLMKQNERPGSRSSKSQSVFSPTSVQVSQATLTSSKSQSTAMSPCEDSVFFGSKSPKSDVPMLQKSLQLAIDEKDELGKENKVLKASADKWKLKAESLQVQLNKLEKMAQKRDELKASMQLLEKEKNTLLDNKKSLSDKVNSLDLKNSLLVTEIEQLSVQLKTMQKEKQARTVEKHHKCVQTTTVTERPLERTRPGSADSKSRVTFYRTNSQNSDTDVHTDKKMQVSETQAPEMKVACRLNITSRSPTASPSGEKHQRVSHTKSLSIEKIDNNTLKAVLPSNRHLSDSVDVGESGFLSHSQPTSSLKPAVTSVKVSTSIKKETPTKINALGSTQLRHTSPQLQVVTTTTHMQGHSVTTTTVASNTTPLPSSHTRISLGNSMSSAGNSMSSVSLSNQQIPPVTSHVTPSTISPQSQVTTANSPQSGITTIHSSQPSHQPLVSNKPRPFLKSNTTMSFITTSKSAASPSHSPLSAQKPLSHTTSVPATIVSPSKPTTESPQSNDPSKKMSTLAVNSGVEVVRRRPKPRTHQILDPLKRSSAYFPTDVANQSIHEENELYRCGSLESLKSALFHAASAKVQPSVASSSTSTMSNSVTTTSSTTTVQSGFSPPTSKFTSVSKVRSQECKVETKPVEVKKEVKFAGKDEANVAPPRARLRGTRHQSINTALPPVSSYYTPSIPTSKVESSVAKPNAAFASDIKPGEVKLKRSNTTGSAGGRPTKKTLLLRWCQKITEEYENIDIRNFSDSFSDGLAFCAIIHHFAPTKIPYMSLTTRSREKNFQLAFDAAEEEGIPRLLDVSDMVSLPVPDWMSVMTYVACIHKHFVM
ncbi:cytospin-B-like isoform X2 [Dysidea avara]|uniref:cytospin-B-like isoform X2 n=1 Tax=Dysidea avara TaxID=196820 RepID=UPI00331ED174